MRAETAEVLRYLGRRRQKTSAELNDMVEECMQSLRKEAPPRHVKREFGITRENDGILLQNSRITLNGKDICRHLEGCERVLLFAATLGAVADNIIRRWESADITRALVCDACATVLIEKACDAIELAAAEAAETSFAVTSRYSPGYGDLPLDVQPEILSALDAERKIGLTCTESLILLPRKSVTAIIGTGGGVCRKAHRCSECSQYSNCAYRR